MTKEYLNEMLEYRDGALYFKKLIQPNQRKVGDRAGSLHHSGYRHIFICGKHHREHRIIWMMHNGIIDSTVIIDHKDRDKTNNRLENLRIANKPQNSHNQIKRITNTSGYKGVSYHKRDKKYQAYILVNYKRKNLGYFDTPEEASDAYKQAAIELHGEFANY